MTEAELETTDAHTEAVEHTHNVPLRYTRGLAAAVALLGIGATVFLITFDPARPDHNRQLINRLACQVQQLGGEPVGGAKCPPPPPSPSPTAHHRRRPPTGAPAPGVTVIPAPNPGPTVIVVRPPSSSPAHPSSSPAPRRSSPPPPSRSPRPSPTPCLAYNPLTGRCLTVALITAIRGGPYR